MTVGRAPAWVRYLAALVAVWLLLCAIAVGAVVRMRANARADREHEFGVRTRISAQIVGSYITDLHIRQLGWANAVLDGATVSRAQVELACTTIGFNACGVFDSRGVLLTNFPYIPSLIGRRFLFLEQVREPLRTGKPKASQVNIAPSLGEPVVAFAMPFETVSGRRVFSGVFSVQRGTLARRLTQAIELPTHDIFVVDASGNVGATVESSSHGGAVALSAYDPSLARALRRAPAGEVGDRYFASAEVPGAAYRLVTAVDDSVLYHPIRGLAIEAVWMVGIAGALGLLLVLAATRALHHRAEAARLQTQAEERQRYAREVNDTIVQGLVAAETAYDLGGHDEARRLLGAVSARARHWIGEQLDAGGTAPGSLRREHAADDLQPKG